MPDSAQPSTANIAAACAIVGLVTGYLIGQAKSLGLFGGSPISAPAARREKDAQPLESDESSDEEDGGGNAAEGLPNEECKLALVVRTDLGMTKGKIGAQCGHATLACYKRFLRRWPDSPIMKRWEYGGQMKVALQVKGEEELEMLRALALSLNLTAEIIHDAGRTQIASGSATVLGIGPAPKSLIDQVTGSLKLL